MAIRLLTVLGYVALGTLWVLVVWAFSKLGVLGAVLTLALAVFSPMVFFLPVFVDPAYLDGLDDRGTVIVLCVISGGVALAWFTGDLAGLENWVFRELGVGFGTAALLLVLVHLCFPWIRAFHLMKESRTR